MHFHLFGYRSQCTVLINICSCVKVSSYSKVNELVALSFHIDSRHQQRWYCVLVEIHMGTSMEYKSFIWCRKEIVYISTMSDINLEVIDKTFWGPERGRDIFQCCPAAESTFGVRLPTLSNLRYSPSCAAMVGSSLLCYHNFEVLHFLCFNLQVCSCRYRQREPKNLRQSILLIILLRCMSRSAPISCVTVLSALSNGRSLSQNVFWWFFLLL